MVTIEVATTSGPARVSWQPVTDPRAVLVLGPGASGATSAPDLAVACQVAAADAITVGLVEPPYRVAGRKVPPRGPSVDIAWRECVEHLHALAGADLPLLTGGRSFGSRVACRTAHALGVVGVLCLAYPLHPPGKPERSRADELAAAEPLPVLVVQGERDPFGRPEPGPNRQVVVVAGDHGLKKDLPAVSAAIGTWLSAVLP